VSIERFWPFFLSVVTSFDVMLQDLDDLVSTSAAAC
jgi:hypothetical protein